MLIVNAAAAIIAILLMIYLLVALLRPEIFS